MIKTLFVFFVLYIVRDQRGEYTEGENIYYIGKMRYIAKAVYAEEGLTLHERVERILFFERKDLTEGGTGVTISSEYDPAVGKDEK